jgi:hypothetical protein
MLSYLDGVDRIRAAMHESSLGNSEGQGFYATWAVKSFEKAHMYLAHSNAKPDSCRPEFSPEVIANNAAALRQSALTMITSEAISIMARPILVPVENIVIV